MLEIKRKEYTKNIDGDMINIALRNSPPDYPPTQNRPARLSLETYRNVNNDTKNLVQNAGFSLSFSLADLKKQGE